jgi:transglutaminase-like putative cysteine protease
VKKSLIVITVVIAVSLILAAIFMFPERPEEIKKPEIKEEKIPEFTLKIVCNRETRILKTEEILSMTYREEQIGKEVYRGIELRELCGDDGYRAVVRHREGSIELEKPEGLIVYSKNGEFLEGLNLLLPSGKEMEGIESIEFIPPGRRVSDVLVSVVERVFSPPTEITATITVNYDYESVLSAEIHVSDVSQSPREYLWNQSTIIRFSEDPTRTADYASINMQTWEKKFEEESSGGVNVEYEVVSKRENFEGNKEFRIEETPSWARQRYLKGEHVMDSGNNEIKLIEMNDEIRELAESIVKNEDRIYYASELLYNWVVDNIEYKKDTDPYPKGAARTLIDRVGDCDDMSALFISLARSLGIACYPVDGYVIKREGSLPYAHTWASVIVPSDEGIFDALPVDPAFREFGVKSAQKIVIGFDPGSEDYLQKVYRAFRFTYENSDGTNGSAAIVAVASRYLDNKDPLYDVKRRIMI